MTQRLFDHDPVSGITTWFQYHDENDAFSLHTVQETDDVVDANKRDFNGAASNWRGDMHKVASIPMTLYMDLKKQGIIDDEKAFKKWLNDPDNRYFRTRPGKV